MEGAFERAVSEVRPDELDQEAFRRAIRARDHAAWTRLTAQCLPVLLRYAARHLPRGSDPESAVQSALYQAFRKASRYDPARSPFPWLAGYCVRECLHQRRKTKLDREALSHAEPNRVDPGGHPGVLRPDACRAVERALEDLSNREYQVLTLRFGFRVSTIEIGQLLRIGTRAAQTTVTRALRRLRGTECSDDLREWLTCLMGDRVET
jgi:RNA polymerase sigma factor (sigma-70 family)